MEEFNLEVLVDKLIFIVDTESRIAFYFVCTCTTTKIELGGPEKERMTPDDNYTVEWVNINELDKLNIIPLVAKEAIKKHLDNPSIPTFFVSSNK